MDLTGQTLLGKYQIEGLLGQGGMGAVWRARHALTGRKLAIKTLDESYLDNEAVVQRFGREARAASAVQHPGIVEVLDLDQTEEGIPFLVMEFLEGETLASRIERRGRLDQDELVHLGTLLLEALDAAHAHGVIHRDLKPENIYVVPAGRRGEIVKILDFGISHKRDEAGAKLTMTGSVLGTPHYMSPEQAMGETEVDHRADLYAAGVVLYECAVGDVPFDAPNYNKLLRTILDQQPAPPRRRGAQISPQVERLILWAMEKERDQRVSSATEMSSWLERAAAGEEVPYTPPAPLAARSASSSQSIPAFRPAGSLPITPAGSLPPARGVVASTLGDGDYSPADSWRPVPPPRSTPGSAAPARSTPGPVSAPRSDPSIEIALDASHDDLELELPPSREHALPKRAPAALPGLDIDEEALRPRSIPPPSTASSSGAYAAPVLDAVRTGRHSIPPRVSDISGRFAPVESPPPSAEPPTWRRYAIFGALALLVFVGLVVAVRWVVRPGERTEETGVGARVEGPSQPTEPSASGPSWVSVRIEGLPPGARVRLDGLPASSPIRVLSGGRHDLELRAPGYAVRRLSFTADRNRTIEAAMRPAEPEINP